MREQLQIPPRIGQLERPEKIARRLGDGGWRNGRLALGVLLVLTAVLGGATVLRQADRTVAVLAASRDLPSGTELRPGDLRAVHVRLPEEQLVHYARAGDRLAGGRLVGALRRDALVPVALVVRDPLAIGLVEYPIPVEPTAVPGGLRPGDRVAVVVAGDGQGERGRVLLGAVEVIRLLRGVDGFASDDRVLAVEVRMPKEHLAAVAGAVAGGHVSLARLAQGDTDGVTGATPAGTAGQAWRPAPGRTVVGRYPRRYRHDASDHADRPQGPSRPGADQGSLP